MVEIHDFTGYGTAPAPVDVGRPVSGVSCRLSPRGVSGFGRSASFCGVSSCVLVARCGADAVMEWGRRGMDAVRIQSRCWVYSDAVRVRVRSRCWRSLNLGMGVGVGSVWKQCWRGCMLGDGCWCRCGCNRKKWYGNTDRVHNCFSLEDHTYL